MLIFALDAALARASAALVRFEGGADVVAEASRDAQRGQPALLPALAAEVLAGLDGPPDAVAVGIGPGGFTGLRAAIALAEGFSLGWGVPLLGVTTGEALAAALTEEEATGREAWSVTTAGRGGLVLERAGAAPVLLDEAALPVPSGPVVLVGDAAALATARLLARGSDARLSGARMPRARFVAAAAMRRRAAGLPDRAAAPLYAEPLYVKAA